MFSELGEHAEHREALYFTWLSSWQRPPPAASLGIKTGRGIRVLSRCVTDMGCDMPYFLQKFIPERTVITMEEAKVRAQQFSSLEWFTKVVSHPEVVLPASYDQKENIDIWTGLVFSGYICGLYVLAFIFCCLEKKGDYVWLKFWNP